MISQKITINLDKKDDTIYLEPLGDIHVGHVGFDKQAYLDRCEAIGREDNRYTLFMGDQLDAINIYDKRFQPNSVKLHEIDDQRQQFHDLTQGLIDIQLERSTNDEIAQYEYNPTTNKMDMTKRKIKRIKKGQNPKIWGLLHGNHEYKIKELTEQYLKNNFCYNNGIDFLGAKCYISLDIKYKSKILGQWSIMAMHGSGGGKPEGMLRQMRVGNYMDVFLCGHVHQKYYGEKEVMDMDHEEGKVWGRQISLANTGTFCHAMTENVSGYMDTKNEVDGSPIGTATIAFNAESGKVNGHI
jgi:hypothetical protein